MYSRTALLTNETIRISLNFKLSFFYSRRIIILINKTTAQLDNDIHIMLRESFWDRHMKWFTGKYLGDWIIAIVLLLLAIVFDKIPPYRQVLPMPNKNPTVGYPEKDSYVPTVLAGVLAYGIPIVLYLIFEIVSYKINKKWPAFHDFHHAVLALLESAGLTLFVVNLIKPFAGRYRPHYLAVRYDEDPYMEFDGRRSFPSGHSACAFSGFGVLAFWAAGKLGMYSKGRAGQAYKGFIFILPLVSAFMIAITRTRDYHHNFSDIIAGSIIGLICAGFSYFNLFPSLFDKDSHLPRDANFDTTLDIIRRSY